VESISLVPELGSAAWATLADTDTRKLAAALRPALAQLVDRTPDVIAAQLRAELDARATVWRHSLVELHNDLSQGWHDLGYGVGPTHTELVHRRTTYPCGQCRRPLRSAVTACADCGWREPTPEQLRTRAHASWVNCETFDIQGAA
jgi:hypothetical protein